MEEKRTILDKVNAWFTTNEIPAEVVEKFEDQPLVDGVTILTAEPTLEAGSVVALTSNEETIPAPVGEYELQDGRIVVVLEEGMIAEVVDSAAEEEEPEVVEEPMKEESKTNEKVKRLIERIEKEQIFEKFAESTSKNEALETKLAESEIKFTALSEEFESFKNMVKETFEQMLEEPKKEPVVKIMNPFGEKKQNIFTKNLKTK